MYEDNPKSIKVTQNYPFSKENVEKQILLTFEYLNNDSNLHRFFCSYDFREEEKDMLEVWSKILDFLYNNIFHTFGMTMEQIKNYTIIKNQIPIGLPNIIQEFRIQQKFITNSDLNKSAFYKFNYPGLFSNENNNNSWTASIFSGIKKLTNFSTDMSCCGKKEEEEVKIRSDISDEEKYNSLPDDTILFNFKLFKKNCDDLLNFLCNILEERDIEIISLKDFISEINNSQNSELLYGTIYIDYCLKFLSNIKKIILFYVEMNNQKTQFIKLIINKNDKTTEKDITLAKLSLQSQQLENRLKDLDNKSNYFKNKVKECLKLNNKNQAKTFLMRQKLYEKNIAITNNAHSALTQQILDLKNMEDNVKTAEILKSCLEITKNAGVGTDEFSDLTNELAETKNSMDAFGNDLKDLAGDNDAEIEEEMQKLENENNNENLEFPMANKDPINPFEIEEQNLYKSN